MDKYRKIAELLRAGKESKETFFTATFVSSQGETCTVNVDGLELDGVRLRPTTTDTENKVLLTPAEGSNVLVGSFSGNFSSLFVLQADSISEILVGIDENISVKINKDGIVLNGGKNDGLMKIKSVVEWMQKVYGDLQTLKEQLKLHPVTGNGAVLGLTFEPETPNPQQSTFEDKNVKH